MSMNMEFRDIFTMHTILATVIQHFFLHTHARQNILIKFRFCTRALNIEKKIEIVDY